MLVEFRQRLLSGKSDLLLFDLRLPRLREGGYLKVRGRQRSNSTHMLAKIRSLNRIEGVGETFRAALNSLAVAAPEWLTEQMQEDWVDRYAHRVEDYRLPTGKQSREDYAVVIGKDGSNLLSAISAAEAPGWVREIPAVQTLRRVWDCNTMLAALTNPDATVGIAFSRSVGLQLQADAIVALVVVISVKSEQVLRRRVSNRREA